MRRHAYSVHEHNPVPRWPWQRNHEALLPEEILKHFDGNMNEAHIHLAAWTVVGNVLLNLDETFMCP